MPVSRKRKKKKSGNPARPRKQATLDQHGSGPGRNPHELAAALQKLDAERSRFRAMRTARAAEVATELVADLVATVVNQPDTDVDDALCLRIGALLAEAEKSPLDDGVTPSHLPQALVSAAASAVEAAVEQGDAWRAPWSVLIAMSGILPYPERETAAEAITRLRNTAGGRALPAAPPGPAVTGPVRWTRDRYGSRFAITAPITTAGRPERCYLWDIDTCGHDAFTVHSGFYDTAESALAAWQGGVGPVAAADTELTPVDDPWLVAQLLPVEQGILRSGGESAAQFAEYHRSRRLGESVKEAIPLPETQPVRDLDAAKAAVEFAAWLRTHTSTQPLPHLDELAGELAASWCFNKIDAVYATCSPHRVALCAMHLRSYYVEELAELLMALLPEWTRWLTERNATPAELADRCLPYAEGKPHPQLEAEIDQIPRIVE